MSGEANVDFCGHEITAKKNEAIEYIDQHIKSYILYEGDMKTAILNAIENDPSCILALVMSASFFLSRYEFTKADFYLKEASKFIHNANDRETMLYEATKEWRKGDMEKALKIHIECLEKFPKDLWNAKKTQLHAFNNGKKDQLLKVSKIVYDACKNEVHLLKYAHGMHLFALQENKYYQTVIDHLDERLKHESSQNNIDCWSVHAICHSLHGLGLIDEGIKWMERWTDSWNNLSNFMYTHNWWHLSFLYVEKGDINSALNIYDNKLMSRTKTISVLVNALGLLLRMEVRKVDCGDRVLNLLSYIENKKFWHYDPFFDIFVVFCLSKCGKKHSVETFFKSLEERISQMKQFINYKEESFDFFNCYCSNTWNFVVKPMAKAIDHYFKNEYEECFECSEKIITEETYFNINASNEQIEVFIEMFIDVLMQLNKKKQAKELIDKQIVGMKNITPHYKSLLEKIELLV